MLTIFLIQLCSISLPQQNRSIVQYNSKDWQTEEDHPEEFERIHITRFNSFNNSANTQIFIQRIENVIMVLLNSAFDDCQE